MYSALGDFFLALALVGALLCVWVNALIAHGHFFFETRLLAQLRRVALAAVGLGMLWAARFAWENGWQPWPPCVLVTAGVDLYLAVAVISAYRRLRMKVVHHLDLAVSRREPREAVRRLG